MFSISPHYNFFNLSNFIILIAIYFFQDHFCFLFLNFILLEFFSLSIFFFFFLLLFFWFLQVFLLIFFHQFHPKKIYWLKIKFLN